MRRRLHVAEGLNNKAARERPSGNRVMSLFSMMEAAGAAHALI
jgi:hypothetical protein